MADIVEQLQNLNERFVFQGGSPFANQLADEIRNLRAEVAEDQRTLIASARQITELTKERDRLRELLRFSMRFWPDHGSFFHNRIIGEHLRCEVCKTKIAIDAALGVEKTP